MEATGSTIIKALEGVYAQCRTKHTDLPTNVVFITGKGANKRGVKLGHFAVDRWSAREDYQGGSETVSEIFIGGECLARGPVAVLKTVVHESVHALAAVREIKDTSRQNRYHNRRFLQLAEELGMEYTFDEPCSKQGFSQVTLCDSTIDSYDLDELDRAISAAIDAGAVVAEPPAPRKPRQVVVLTFESDQESFEVSVKVYEDLADRLDTHTATLELR